MVEILDLNKKYDLSYCIPLWLRDEQIRLSTARCKNLLKEVLEINEEPIALVGYGPSLVQTWEKIRDFKYVMSCSGAHKFLVERGIIPTWHVEVDPRPHKTQLIGPPHPDVEYLIGSPCHKAVFDHLEGYNVKLWHVYDEDDGSPKPEGWALTGGQSVGLRTLTLARFLGFVNFHIFGMDGSEGETGKHAAFHPNQPKGHQVLEYPAGSGRMWRTTVSMMTCAKQTFHELNSLPGATAVFYGEGLCQTMAKDYISKQKETAVIAKNSPELITPEYVELNRKLHEENLAYGVGGGKHVKMVLDIAKAIPSSSILDYGCGKGYLGKAIPFPIWEYDPAIPGKEAKPRPTDLVVCTDVLEHIEPEKLKFVLADLRRCTKRVGYFVIHTGPAVKVLADGRNTHLIQHKRAWWEKRIRRFFDIGKVWEMGREIHMVVGPQRGGKPYVTEFVSKTPATSRTKAAVAGQGENNHPEVGRHGQEDTGRRKAVGGVKWWRPVQ